ncbi:tRNA 2-thiouridine(34) synthase MnmA [Blochmannia endosymbiont of Camponotus sp.]|uniref:tRNA 2-thiouridine(34) synthase MnmA n=1 Tax=Blochmannia endosymbiont of Camponotus sp. TaxID=700220 RepID=UPI0020257347|nr:tRNA 2-thiouridine(34) synthase MnmA [Blochmannia endosymbiont of Camponotus sp.]URJ31110.1 tRNA 2-thiouridine(34) synthase MnmA [Blochmannia endosymbiont of Camponotus sp.]
MLHTHRKKKVIVGMSGGVDSSVSAWILLQQGYEVEGLFMKNWEDDDSNENCASASDLSDAHSVCNHLGIYLHTVNFSKEYWENVFQVFLQEYRIGRTPNPDILCNKEIKFKCFLEFALKDLDADFIATGHYVRRIDTNQGTCLMRGLDKNKDQSYFLYTLSHTKLKQCLFPIGILNKSQVRSIAQELNLITANKKNSTGICFIGKRKFINFISNYIPIQPGMIINVNGDKIGTHQGVSFYTLGQRKGLNIGGIKRGNGKPWYVIDKDIKNNTLIAAQEHHHPLLMSAEFIAKQVQWIKRNMLKSPLHCTVKTRYRHPDVQCYIYPIFNNNLKVILKNPISAITPGQSAVFYSHENCLGGGIIEKAIPYNYLRSKNYYS